MYRLTAVHSEHPAPPDQPLPGSHSEPAGGDARRAGDPDSVIRSAEPDLVVRHLRQILMWPLQLMPADLQEEDLQPWERLERSAQPHPWKELADEFTADPAQFQERHYREFVTFLPHVQRFLYGQGRAAHGHVGYGESPIRIFRRTDLAAIRMHFAEGEPLDCAIQHADLYFFYDIDIVVPVLEIRADNIPLSRVQEVLYRFGRASPGGWNPDGSPQSCLVAAEWIGHAGQVLARSDMGDREAYLAFTARHRAQNVAAHWRYLLQPMALHHSDEPGSLRYRQIEYHRMPKLTYIAVDDPFALSEDRFLRLALAMREESGELPFSQAARAELAASVFYDRFWNPQLRDARAPMRVSCNGAVMTMVGSWNDAYFRDAEAGLLGQFRHQYFLVGLIAHFHKAALLMLSDRLITAVSMLNVRDPASQARFRQSIRQTREVFLRFNHRYWFHEVSNQSMARDLFERWGHHLGTDALFHELREELLDMGGYLDSDDARQQGESVLRLTVVTILGLVGTIVTGFLGMNLIDAADESLSYRVLFALLVTLPVTLLALATVRHSRILARWLDIVADDQPIGLRERWQRLVQSTRRSRRG